MQVDGIREERGSEENRNQRGINRWEQAEWDQQHLLQRWDFEELLADLRRNPVLKCVASGAPIIAKEYFARA
ncbi:hypothetical protein KDL29_04550 [bacterium]|nr:hypothetical protein [bacterium]